MPTAMSLTAAASAGDTTIQVDGYQCGLAPGARIAIGSETAVVRWYISSIRLQTPLLQSYPAGTSVALIVEPPPPPPSTSPPPPVRLQATTAANLALLQGGTTRLGVGGALGVVIGVLFCLVFLICCVWCLVYRKRVSTSITIAKARRQSSSKGMYDRDDLLRSDDQVLDEQEMAPVAERMIDLTSVSADVSPSQAHDIEGASTVADAQTSTHSSELFAAAERFDITVERAEAALRRSPTRGRSPRPSIDFSGSNAASRWPYERFTVELRANSEGQFRIQLMQEDENGLGLVDATQLKDQSSDATGDISVSLIGNVDVHDDRSKILKGDVVRQVNGKDVVNKSLYAVQQMLLSTGGERVQLTLERPRPSGSGSSPRLIEAAQDGPASRSSSGAIGAIERMRSSGGRPSPTPHAAKMSTAVPELHLGSPELDDIVGVEQPVDPRTRSRGGSRGGSRSSTPAFEGESLSLIGHARVEDEDTDDEKDPPPLEEDAGRSKPSLAGWNRSNSSENLERIRTNSALMRV